MKLLEPCDFLIAYISLADGRYALVTTGWDPHLHFPISPLIISYLISTIYLNELKVSVFMHHVFPILFLGWG